MNQNQNAVAYKLTLTAQINSSTFSDTKFLFDSTKEIALEEAKSFVKTFPGSKVNVWENRMGHTPRCIKVVMA